MILGNCRGREEGSEETKKGKIRVEVSQTLCMPQTPGKDDLKIISFNYPNNPMK